MFISMKMPILIQINMPFYTKKIRLRAQFFGPRFSSWVFLKMQCLKWEFWKFPLISPRDFQIAQYRQFCFDIDNLNFVVIKAITTSIRKSKKKWRKIEDSVSCRSREKVPHPPSLKLAIEAECGCCARSDVFLSAFFPWASNDSTYSIVLPHSAYIANFKVYLLSNDS